MLAWAFDITATGIERTPSVRGLHVTNKRQVLVLGFVGTLIAAVALFSYWFWHPWRPTATASTALTSVSVPEKSIAVLPFENLSTEKENVFFTNGVQDEILTNLAKVADLKVISHWSVQQYKSGVARNLKEIGQQLGVAYLLEGSVQRIPNRLRVNARLIDARSNSQVWADTYDRDVADLFRFKATSHKPSWRSFAPNFRRRRKRISRSGRQAIWSRSISISRPRKLLIRILKRRIPGPRCCERCDCSMKRRNAIRNLRWLIAMRHARMISFIFSILIHRPRATCSQKQPLKKRYSSVPIFPRRMSRWQITSFAVIAITNERSRNLFWRDHIFRTAFHFSRLPVTSSAGAVNGRKRNTISLRRLRSIRAIRMP